MRQTDERGSGGKVREGTSQMCQKRAVLKELFSSQKKKSNFSAALQFLSTRGPHDARRGALSDVKLAAQPSADWKCPKPCGIGQ